MDVSVFAFAKNMIRDGQGTVHGFTRYRIDDSSDSDGGGYGGYEDITLCNRHLGRKWTMVHVSERINCLECLGSEDAEG